MNLDLPDWVRDATFYQIFPDRFAASDRVPKPGPLEAWDSPPTQYGFKGGDLRGIVEHLPYLDDLGVTALYLTPIFASASNHRYHTYDYFRVDPLLGGDDALRDLLDAAHERGMRVILDGVFNHTGRGFWPFHHVLETGAASPYRHWFHLDQEALDTGRPLLAYPGADARRGVALDDPWVGQASPSSDGTASRERLGYAAWWDLPALPKLNTDHPGVRDHLFSVAEHWLRFGIDGWRLDVPEEIRDESFWQEFRRRCRAVQPEAYLVGEIWHVAPEWLAGDRFDALMDYPLAEAIMSFVGGESLDLGIVHAHHEYATTIRPEDAATFAGRVAAIHDAYGPEVAAVSFNLLGSHDAPRLRTVLGADTDAVRLATLLQATLPGAPCIYYGDEVGLEGGNDPGPRGAFPWDEGRQDTGLRGFVRSVLRHRRAEESLRRGSFTILAADGPLLAYERALDDRRCVVVVNAGTTARPLRLSLPGVTGTLQPLPLGAHSEGAPVALADGVAELDLAPRSGQLLRVS
jgi:cyclomaltodextrinase